MNADSSTVNRVAGNAWFVGLIAVLELLLGFAMLSFPYLLGASAVWVAGIAFLAAGVIHLIQAITRAGSRLWSLLSGLLYLAVGVMLVFLTWPSMAILTLAIGIALLAGGILRLAIAFSMRCERGCAWRFFNAIISLILGGFVIWSWPESSLWLIGTIIAVEMIFSGWTLLFIALSPRGNEA